MGTSNSHTGSNKKWGAVSDAGLDDWLSSLPDGDGADDTGGDPQDASDAANSDTSGDRAQDGSPVPPLPATVRRRIAQALRSGADGPGGGGGAGRRGATGTGGSSRGSTGFARSAARAGGRVVAGISAFQRGDADALAEIGLSLGALEALEDDWDRAVAIADAATDSDPNAADDEDLRWATVQTAAWALGQDQTCEVRELIERFVADFVYRKVSYEIGHSFRDGSGDGANTVGGERSLRASIRICVRSEIEADFSDRDSAAELSDLVARVYDYTVEAWGTAQ